MAYGHTSTPRSKEDILAENRWMANELDRIGGSEQELCRMRRRHQDLQKSNSWQQKEINRLHKLNTDMQEKFLAQGCQHFFLKEHHKRLKEDFDGALSYMRFRGVADDYEQVVDRNTFVPNRTLPTQKVAQHFQSIQQEQSFVTQSPPGMQQHSYSLNVGAQPFIPRAPQFSQQQQAYVLSPRSPPFTQSPPGMRMQVSQQSYSLNVGAQPFIPQAPQQLPSMQFVQQQQTYVMPVGSQVVDSGYSEAQNLAPHTANTLVSCTWPSQIYGCPQLAPFSQAQPAAPQVIQAWPVQYCSVMQTSPTAASTQQPPEVASSKPLQVEESPEVTDVPVEESPAADLPTSDLSPSPVQEELRTAEEPSPAELSPQLTVETASPPSSTDSGLQSPENEQVELPQTVHQPIPTLEAIQEVPSQEEELVIPQFLEEFKELPVVSKSPSIELHDRTLLPEEVPEIEWPADFSWVLQQEYKELPVVLKSPSIELHDRTLLPEEVPEYEWPEDYSWVLQQPYSGEDFMLHPQSDDSAVETPAPSQPAIPSKPQWWHAGQMTWEETQTKTFYEYNPTVFFDSAQPYAHLTGV